MDLQKWFLADELLKRWGIRDFELLGFMTAKKLPVYSKQNQARPINPAVIFIDGYPPGRPYSDPPADASPLVKSMYHQRRPFPLSGCLFRGDDVLAFEGREAFRVDVSAPVSGPLQNDIRVQQALKGAVALALACERQMKETGRPMTCAMANKLIDGGFKRVPEYLFRLIWAAIPADLKKGPGRPAMAPNQTERPDPE